MADDDAEVANGDEVAEVDVPTRETTKDDRTWAMFTHLSAFSGTVLQIPFANVIVPLIIWQVKKDGSKFIDHQGREVVNFQITVLIGMLVSIPLMFVIIGFLTFAAVVIGSIVLTIIGAIKANEGTWYTYPWSIKFVKPAPLPGS